ncbi:amidohydrolase family protein [Knoellia subterranea]|uniref:Amidohydrolase n=1 Tax=Knoellia subterranea KCTC 19937 TaxID=1385521 RepID=A0A0A0JNZ9_9MICO|nr:amidohydrolase family protein [Knoellia subterranea]KGN37777.1 amidohydrolase [Knoellia subterranea KCTC 19937]
MPTPSVPLPPDEAALVRSRLDALGLPGMIDVHTHFMPKRVLDKVWAYFDSAGPKLGREWPIAYRGTDEERVDRLREFGVERFTSLSYPHKPGMAGFLNAWSADFAGAHPDVLRSATFFPEPGADRYVREAISAGVQVFKVHVQVGEFDPNDTLLDGVWGALSDSGTPVVIHCGDGPLPGPFTGAAGASELLRRFPRLTLVVAHMGMPEYAEFLDLVAAHERVHLDTTMSFTDFTESMHPFPAELRGRLADLGERVLFGSDYPNIPYSYLHAVDAVLGLDLGDDWARKVLRENAVRLFDLEA